jgi:hypothetical protein
LKTKQSKGAVLKGVFQFEISNMLHISQSTISRDINYMQSKINKGDVDPDDQLLVECEKIMLNLDEMVEELWKIIDSTKTGSKEKAKSINLILNVTKERSSILEKDVDIIRMKMHKDLFGDRSP